eukprot:Skav222003  [mRNA]  locus=scaffold2020:93848:97136:+ [translate_table: standard]
MPMFSSSNGFPPSVLSTGWQLSRVDVQRPSSPREAAASEPVRLRRLLLGCAADPSTAAHPNALCAT